MGRSRLFIAPTSSRRAASYERRSDTVTGRTEPQASTGTDGPAWRIVTLRWFSIAGPPRFLFAEPLDETPGSADTRDDLMLAEPAQIPISLPCLESRNLSGVGTLLASARSLSACHRYSVCRERPNSFASIPTFSQCLNRSTAIAGKRRDIAIRSCLSSVETLLSLQILPLEIYLKMGLTAAPSAAICNRDYRIT